MKCLIPLFMVVATCYCATLTDVLFAEWTEFKVNKICFMFTCITLIYNICVKLLIENKLIICALGNLHYKISREKFEPKPGFEPWTSGFLAWALEIL